MVACYIKSNAANSVRPVPGLFSLDGGFCKNGDASQGEMLKTAEAIRLAAVISGVGVSGRADLKRLEVKAVLGSSQGRHNPDMKRPLVLPTCFGYNFAALGRRFGERNSLPAIVISPPTIGRKERSAPAKISCCTCTQGVVGCEEIHRTQERNKKHAC